jgi:hypothetical protein
MLLLLNGWVHRDISSGNLLLYVGRGILSDLEYARRYSTDHEASKDPKTVSHHFDFDLPLDAYRRNRARHPLCL